MILIKGEVYYKIWNQASSQIDSQIDYKVTSQVSSQGWDPIWSYVDFLVLPQVRSQIEDGGEE